MRYFFSSLNSNGRIKQHKVKSAYSRVDGRDLWNKNRIRLARGPHSLTHTLLLLMRPACIAMRTRRSAIFNILYNGALHRAHYQLRTWCGRCIYASAQCAHVNCINAVHEPDTCWAARRCTFTLHLRVQPFVLPGNNRFPLSMRAHTPCDECTARHTFCRAVGLREWRERLFMINIA